MQCNISLQLASNICSFTFPSLHEACFYSYHIIVIITTVLGYVGIEDLFCFVLFFFFFLEETILFNILEVQN